MDFVGLKGYQGKGSDCLGGILAKRWSMEGYSL